MIRDLEPAPADGRRERQFADAVTLVISLVVLAEAIGWAVGERGWTLTGALVLLALLFPVRRARALAIRGEPARAARWTGAGLMLAALSYAFVLPRLAPVLAVVPLMVVALLLPHRPTAPGRRQGLLIGAWFGSLAIMVITVVLGPEVALSAFGFVDGFILFALAMTHALTLVLFGQYDSRVRENLDRIEASERRLRAVVATAADGVLVIDERGLVTRANAAAATLFGRASESLIGRSVEHLIDLAPEALSPTSSQGGQPTTGRRRDGRAFPAEVSIGARFGDGDGEQVLVVRDVTERARAAVELARRAEALVRSNQELERFAYVASHDLQEPLRKIQAFGALLDESARDRLDPEEQQALDYLIDAATRQRTLINDLLAYSRARTRPRQVGEVDLGEVFGEVLDTLSERIEASAAVIESDPLPVVRADRSQMRQLFQNLLSNALKYASADRRPRIAVRCSDLPASAPAEGATEHPASGDGTAPAAVSHPPAGWRLQVSDNGIGFEQRFAERIFEPFRRLHPRHTYPGSGVGLAICRQIAERHGGTITARGVPDEGASFCVELPLARIDRGLGDGRGEREAHPGHDTAG